MRLIIEEIDGAIYQDVILSEEEVMELQRGDILEATTFSKSKRYYVGVRAGENWRYNDPNTFTNPSLLE